MSKNTKSTVEFVEDQRSIKELRKGVPDEYKELLAKGKADYGVMVEKTKEAAVVIIDKAKEQVSELKNSAKDKAAKIYVPKLYKILIAHEYPPKNARAIITDDCTKIWTERHVLRWMPKETKHPGRSSAGSKSGKVRGERRDEKNKQTLEQLEEIFPDIKKEDPKTQEHAIKMATGMNSPKVTDAVRTAVAKSGGEGKRDKYGNEVFSDMGDRSAEIRHGVFKLAINREEHKELCKAYEQSVDAGAGGSYTIYWKDGGYDRVVPDLNGDAEKTVNR